jgi:hypothetical protein
MKSIGSVTLVAAMLFVSACGDTQQQRMITGGAIGVGAGAIGGALVGGSVLGAAVLGGVAGVAIGALTDKDQINLNR